MTRGRLLGVDYGRKRIGLAIGDLETRIAMPLRTLGGTGDLAKDAQLVAKSAADEEVDTIVVGLPVNLADGSDSEQTKFTRRFAKALEQVAGRPVHLHDERLSSYAATEKLEEAGIKARPRDGLTDRLAAQEILQAYFDSKVDQ